MAYSFNSEFFCCWSASDDHVNVHQNVLKWDLVLFVNQWHLRVAILTPMQVCFVNFLFLSVCFIGCVNERLVFVFLNKLGVWGNNSLLNHALISCICVLLFTGPGGWVTLNVVSQAPARVPAHTCIPNLFHRGGASSFPAVPNILAQCQSSSCTNVSVQLMRKSVFGHSISMSKQEMKV